MRYYYMGVPRRYRWAHAGGAQVPVRMPMDMRSEDEAYLITAAVPGLSADDLEIEVLDDMLTLRGTIESEDESSLVSRIDRAGGYFRRVRLPEPINSEEIEARVENGLLTVRVPKAEEVRPKRIEVQKS